MEILPADKGYNTQYLPATTLNPFDLEKGGAPEWIFCYKFCCILIATYWQVKWALRGDVDEKFCVDVQDSAWKILWTRLKKKKKKKKEDE